MNDMTETAQAFETLRAAAPILKALREREQCTPGRKPRAPRTDRKPLPDPEAERALSALKRAAFISLAIAKRVMARIDDPTVTTREREAMNFNLRQALRYTTELLSHSGESVAPTL